MKRPKGECLQIRLAKDEKRKLVAAARRRGLTLSEFIRSTARAVSQGEQVVPPYVQHG